MVFFVTRGDAGGAAGLLPVHNIAEYGPNNPAGTPELIMPDWFLMWVYGFLKLLPSWMSFNLVSASTSPQSSSAASCSRGWCSPRSPSGHSSIGGTGPLHRDPLDRAWQTGVGVAAIRSS